MTETDKKLGNITTFYSYKGGVGRTMALANVAFLCSLNELKVLTIDWDLEAPGLLYYFRGLLDPTDIRDMKDKSGILDMAWHWVSRTDKALGQADVDQLVRETEASGYFGSFVHRVFDFGDGHLDLIMPGGHTFPARDREDVQIGYEAALAEFSWHEFINERAGGILLDNLRDWAKQNYDVVLIDSRTGLADDAGICTVQMPDDVVMCFVLNRQNIDGIARVASAIRRQRSSSVSIHTVPMRVAGTSTAEEADAFSRAKRELVRTGGLDPSMVELHLSALPIKASVAVPYYETLAPIAATTPSRDVATLNYLDLAVHITGRALTIPELDDQWLDIVRQRLAPQHTTIEYLAGLQTAEPERAAEDLARYLDSARNEQLDNGSLDPRYVRAMAELTLQLVERIDPFVAFELMHTSVELLRESSPAGRDEWYSLFVATLERYAQLLGQISVDEDEELAVLEELDTILAVDGNGPTDALKRIGFKVSAARLLLKTDELDRARLSVEELQEMLSSFTAEFGTQRAEQYSTLELDHFVLKGDLERIAENNAGAVAAYEQGFSKARELSSKRVEVARVLFDFAMRLAQTADAEEAPQYALAALNYAPSSSALTASVSTLAEVVLRSEQAQLLVPQFVERAFMNRRMVHLIGAHYGRGAAIARQFADQLYRLAEWAVRSVDQQPEILSSLTDMLISVGQGLTGRPDSMRLLQRRPDRGISDTIGIWVDRFGTALNEEQLATLVGLRALLEQQSSRSPRGIKDR
jgi:cellulose biosynthesis protein BcsQ